MKTHPRLTRFWAVPAVLVVLALLWQINSAQETAGKKNNSDIPQMVSTDTLGGQDRYLTHVSTDKPIYRPAETVFVRGVVLHHATRKPLDPNTQVNSLVEIRGPKGDVVASGYAALEDSVLGFSWQIPAEQAGGQYTVKVQHAWTGDPPAERQFEVRAYRAPRLKSQIKFIRDGYGPGDEVAATLHVERAEGGLPSGAKVTVIARVDGVEVFRGPSTVDAFGNCASRFPLPTEIRRGEGVLAMVIEDGGVVETASKTIPILLQTVDLTIYPEGGDLVTGLRSRVYFEAVTPAGKPADLAGVVIDDRGNEIVAFRSEHEGRGRFELTPQAGTGYRMKIMEPAGIKTTYPLPEVKAEGAVITALHDLYSRQQPIEFEVAATTSAPVSVTLSQRESQLAKVSFAEWIQGGKAHVTFIPPDDSAEGVLVATVWGPRGEPLAERLIYREPARAIKVNVSTNADRATPGSKAQVKIETTDDQGQPVSAVVGLTVTDDSVLEMIEQREQAPRLPVMVLLEPEVRNLADAHVYLDSQNADAPRALDLLLGTQGWRRFAFVRPVDFTESFGDASRRVLALRTPPERDRSTRFRNWAFFFDADGLAENEDRFQVQAQLPASGPVAASAAEAPPEASDVAVNQPAEDERGAIQAAGDQPLSREALLKELAAEKHDAGLFGGAGGGLAAADSPARNDFVAVRVFAHQIRSDRQAGERVDFTETLFWHAGIKTNEEGEANVEFDLNDAITSFRVLADAFSNDGSLGQGTAQLESVKPFYIEPKLPLEVTIGDHVRVPLSAVNATPDKLNAVTVETSIAGVDSKLPRAVQLTLPAEARKRVLLDLPIIGNPGDVDIAMNAVAGAYSDHVKRKFKVQPLGFPVEIGYGGLLNPNAAVQHTITIPKNVVRGSISSRCVVYPTPLASMTQALERLIQEPCGCFEQTSSTTYPLIMAQQYFLSHQGVDPALIERSSAILEQGYNRLIGFECQSGGYEWFGADPGHDALTAYGVLEFTDMAQVRLVDSQMLARTRDWLLQQRDGKGGFERKTHTLHTWLPDPELANCYNLWALLAAGVKADFTREVAWVRKAGETSQNTYVVALAANVLGLAGDREGQDHLLDKLAGQQSDDGSLAGATTSVVGSGGEALQIETTALALLAWLENPRYAPQVEQAVQFLAESCKAGRFGSTQSTVLALRAIVAYDRSRATPKVPGSLQLLVDGGPVGKAVGFTADHQGALELPGLTEVLSPGQHLVEIKMSDGSQMPYSVAVNYHQLTPASSEQCQVHLDVTLRDHQLDEGAATEARVVVVNRTGQQLPTPVAIVGIPGGLEVRHDQLKELVKAGHIAAYEVLGRDVVLYWRVLDAEQRVELPLSLIAAVPGTYTGPASRAYLYYTDEFKQWVDGLRVEIRAVEQD